MFDDAAQRKRGRYAINEREAEIVRLIFHRYADGAGYGDILKELNQRGLKTKRGGQFGKNSLHDLLRNKKYIGIYTYGRVEGGHHEKRNNHKSSEKMIEKHDAMPRIIAQEIWDKVQDRMNGKKRAPGSYTAKENYLLSGLVRCDCGAAMVGSRVVAKGRTYVYYKCDRQQRQLVKSCGVNRVQKDMLEAAVESMIYEELLDPAKLDEIIDDLNKAIHELNSSYEDELRDLKKQRDELGRKISNLLNAIEDGELDDLIKQRLAENKNRLADAQARIEYLSVMANRYNLDSRNA